MIQITQGIIKTYFNQLNGKITLKLPTCETELKICSMVSLTNICLSSLIIKWLCYIFPIRYISEHLNKHNIHELRNISHELNSVPHNRWHFHQYYCSSTAAMFLFFIGAYLIDDQGWHKSGGSGASIRDECAENYATTMANWAKKKHSDKKLPTYCNI